MWNVHHEVAFDTTRSQNRKPLLGSGRARPVGFGPHAFDDRVLIASDGLLKYVPPPRRKALGMRDPIEAAVDALVDEARLPSGALQDDIAIVLVAPTLALPVDAGAPVTSQD